MKNVNQQRAWMQRLDQKGFSLIEIMVAITIIALIVGIVGTNVMKKLDDAKANTANIQMKAFESALDDFRRDNGFYPSTAQGLQALITKPDVPPEPKQYDPEGYLRISTEEKTVPMDPWGNAYEYESEGSGKYKITCLGAGGQQGGEGAEKDIVVSN